MHREPSCPLEPELVARALEDLEERVAVSRRPVADARSLLHAGRSRLPGQLGAAQEQVLVEVRRCTRNDSGRPGAPLEPRARLVHRLEGRREYAEADVGTRHVALDELGLRHPSAMQLDMRKRDVSKKVRRILSLLALAHEIDMDPFVRLDTARRFEHDGYPVQGDEPAKVQDAQRAGGWELVGRG